MVSEKKSAFYWCFLEKIAQAIDENLQTSLEVFYMDRYFTYFLIYFLKSKIIFILPNIFITFIINNKGKSL